MKKQEAINKLESLSIVKSGESTYDEGFYDGVCASIELAKQIDEPQEPETVVFKHDEKFVFEWLNQTISYRFSLYNAMNNGCSDIIEWMKIDDNSNRFAQAFISLKYKLEKQPVWVIKNAEGNYLTKCSLWGKDGVNYSFECNPSDKLLFTDKSIADAAALLVNGTAEQEDI